MKFLVKLQFDHTLSKTSLSFNTKSMNFLIILWSNLPPAQVIYFKSFVFKNLNYFFLKFENDMEHH